jgi:hypothetical protein
MPTDQPAGPDTRDAVRTTRDDLTEALQALELNSVRVLLGDHPDGRVRLSFELDPAEARRLTAHLVPAARLRPFAGAVLWHRGHQDLVTVHKVLSPVRCAVRTGRMLRGVPFTTHIRELSLPSAQQISHRPTPAL